MDEIARRDGKSVDAPREAKGNARFVGLDALRGFAALVVVAYHYDRSFWSTSDTLISRSGSYLAVDFFIILSGFVLAFAFYDKPHFSFWQFTKKRIFRLWPLHALILAGFVAIMLYESQPINTKALTLNALLLHNVGIGRWGFAFNVPSWSLSVELAVNILVGLVIIVIPNRRFNGIVLAIMAVIALALLFTFATNLNAPRKNVYGFINMGLMRGILDFALGILAFRLFRARRGWFERESLFRSLCVAGLLVAFAASFYVPAGSRADLLYLPLYWVVVLLLTYPGAAILPVLKPLRFFGDISFALYLIHMFVFRIMLLVGFTPENYAFGMAISISASVAAATLAHYGFERPVYEWLTKRWGKPAPKPSIQPG